MDTAAASTGAFQGMTAFEVFGAYKDNVKVQLESRTYTQVRSAVIIEDIVADVLKYRIKTIHADASHPFENADLRAEINKATFVASEKDQFRCTLVEVPFGRPCRWRGEKDR